MYADVITTLLLCIMNYTFTLVDGYLPLHLCLMGLATQINMNACICTHAIIHAFVKLLEWKSMGHNRCQSRALLLLLALMQAIKIVILNGRAEVLSHTHQATAPMCRVVVEGAARLRHKDVMHVLIRMGQGGINPIKFVLPVAAPDMLLLTVMFLRLHYSSKSTSNSFWTT
jgi:hypothetical protein